MSIKTFKIWQRTLAAVIAMIIAVSISFGNAVVPIFTVIVAMLLLYLLRRRVKEIMADERTYSIAQKSAYITLQIGAIGMAVTGAAFLALSRGGSPGLAQVGFALEYATCGLLLANYIAYIYYSKKLGGGHE
jgi:uncharacterized membrane protein